MPEGTRAVGRTIYFKLPGQAQPTLRAAPEQADNSPHTSIQLTTHPLDPSVHLKYDEGMTEAVRVLEFESGAEWEAWLEKHHADEPEAWLRIAKRNATLPGLTIEDALDGALCFGWIDGQRRANDAASFLQRYCPRRKTSSWSRINVEKFEALSASGRVRPAGHAEVAAAQADGRWAAAYASQRTAEVPEDLTVALAKHPRAAEAFNALSRSQRYAVILDLLKARSPERREMLLTRAISNLEA